MVLYAAGQVIRANEINALPQIYFVAADIVKNNSNVFSDVTGLAFPADANSRYLVECFIFYRTPAARDIKLTWTFPAGTLGSWGADGIEIGAANSVGQVNRQTVPPSGGIHAFNGDDGLDVNAKPTATFLTAGTAGTIQLQWAQFSAGASDSTIRNGSCIRVTKMA